VRSCHHKHRLGAVRGRERRNGYATRLKRGRGIEEEADRRIGTYLESWRERQLQNQRLPGQADNKQIK